MTIELACREVLSSFLEFVRQECSGPEGGIPVLVAHNGKNFDFKFLNQECKRWTVQLPGDWLWLDSFLLAKECVRDSPGETVSRSLVSADRAVWSAITCCCKACAV